MFCPIFSTTSLSCRRDWRYSDEPVDDGSCRSLYKYSVRVLAIGGEKIFFRLVFGNPPAGSPDPCPSLVFRDWMAIDYLPGFDCRILYGAVSGRKIAWMVEREILILPVIDSFHKNYRLPISL